MSMENYDTYSSQSLTDLRGEVLDLVLDQLCSRETVNYIGDTRFSSGFILVHFPHVRITNEYNRFVDINHLYAKVGVLYNGSINGYFSLNRAEYTYLHISSRYMHSHVSDIPTSDFTEFMNWSPDLSKSESQFKGLFRTDFIRCLTNTKPLPDKYKPVKDKNGNVLEYYYYALDVKHGGLVIKHKSFKGKKVERLKNAKTLDDVIVIKDANKSIESMIKYIFGKNITMDDVNSFESVVEYVKKNIDMEWRTEAIKRFKEEEDRKNTKNRNKAYKILQGII